MRVDTGVEQGDEITPYYDPMIAKLIVWDQTRELALQRMLQALAQYRIVGVANNVEFLSRLVACPAFARADLDTGLIERERDVPVPEKRRRAGPGVSHRGAGHAAARGASARARRPARRRPVFAVAAARDGWRLNSRSERTLMFRYGETRARGRGRLRRRRLSVDASTASPVPARGELGRNGTLRVELAGLRLDASVIVAGEKRHVFLDGRSYPARARRSAVPGQRRAGRGRRPGRADARQGHRVAGEPGTEVEKGAPLLILEAMKMEHTITAPTAGKLAGSASPSANR